MHTSFVIVGWVAITTSAQKIKMNIKYSLVSYSSPHHPFANFTSVAINCEYRDGPSEFVTVLNEAEEASANLTVDLLSSGLMQLKLGKTGKHLDALVAQYKAAETSAKSSRVGIWMYGDISEDESDRDRRR